MNRVLTNRACLPFVALSLLSFQPLLAQASASSWSGHALFGIARTLRGEGLGTDLAIELFLGRRLSRSSVLGLDLAYLRLGSETRRGATITLPPEAAPATFTSSSRHRLYLFGLALDQQLVRAPPAPSFFLGVGYYGVDASSRFTVRDTLGLIDRQSTIEGTSWGPGLSLGLGLRLPTLGHGLRPRVQLRGHVMVVKTEDSWAEYDALSLGLGLAW